MVKSEGFQLKDLESVGVSAPGPIDYEGGLLINPPNLPWEIVSIKKILKREIGIPIYLENDANAAALAEWRFGAAKGYRNIVYLTMSTGIGGGLIIEGRIYRGKNGGAGELGHIPVEWNGNQCACGLRGCLEAYIGGASLTQRLQAIAPQESLVTKLAATSEDIRPEHLVEAARLQDPFALQEMTRFNSYLARGLRTIIFTLSPELIVLGTIVASAGELLCLDPLRELLTINTWSTLSSGTDLVSAGLGQDLQYLAGIAVALESPNPRDN